jgi:hypothetical protein
MKNLTLVLAISLLMFSCKKADDTYSVDTTAEMGQQIGDAMVSVDESGGNSNGAITQFDATGELKTFARLSKDEPIQHMPPLFSMVVPEAQAAACSTVAFATCGSAKRVKDFSGCTLLGGSMSGNITLNYTGTGTGSCTIPMNNDAVSRVPNYSISGLRGATFSVAASTTGQTVTRTGASNFTFANTGIRRSFVTPAGSTILDLTTTTSAAITVTGNSRNTRTMTSGGITVVNNLTSVSCTATPTGVTWGASCNCPTAGSWSGSCTDSTTFTVAFTSTCGQATVTKGTDTSTVTMDRCN